jgi:hypothetical protein
MVCPVPGFAMLVSISYFKRLAVLHCIVQRSKVDKPNGRLKTGRNAVVILGKKPIGEEIG